MHMNLNLETTSQGELALTDWLRLAGLLIFVAFICFSIVLFCKGANHPPANETQTLVRSSAPTAGLELRPEPNPLADPQSVIAVTMSGTRPGSTTSLSGASASPIQQPVYRSTTNAKRTPAIRRHRTYSATRLASRQGSAIHEVVSKSLNMLVGMWRRTWETTKVRAQRVESPR